IATPLRRGRQRITPNRADASGFSRSPLGLEPTIRKEGQAALRRLATDDDHPSLAEYRDQLVEEAGGGFIPGPSAEPVGAWV
ncbi:hypothetical protein, partial [Benzoatithermus flavus]